MLMAFENFDRFIKNFVEIWAGFKEQKPLRYIHLHYTISSKLNHIFIDLYLFFSTYSYAVTYKC